ncbi:MAG: helix-turn-helix transcriptional regulator [Rhodospirillaceae bacterium]|nr:helix-turn-helix transcriptional regulator [Rhodospirillaceae bacterium]
MCPSVIRQAHEPIRRFATTAWEAELLPHHPYETRYTTDRAAIGFAFDMQDGVHAFASDRIHPFRVRALSLAFTPAGCEVYSRSPKGGEYLRLILRSRTEEPFEPPRFTNTRDIPAVMAARHLRAMLLTPRPIDPLLFEHHATALAERAYAVHTASDDTADAGRWMTSGRLKHISEMVEARLENGVTVEEMAHTLGLSTDFFSRAFKAATGQTPHAYVISRRIARARALISAEGNDLSAVAYSVGFSSHAHMSAVFRQHLNVTPSTLRQSLSR